MVYWWVLDSYFNNEQITISDVVLMNAEYGSSVSFVSRVRSKNIVHNTYTGRRSNLCSKPRSMHKPVHKYDFNYSYSRSHFSWLPQAVYKARINNLCQKVSYASMIIDPVMNRFGPNEAKIHFHICDNPIITFGIRGLCLEISNTSHVDILDRFIKSVVDKVKFYIRILKKS